MISNKVLFFSLLILAFAANSQESEVLETVVVEGDVADTSTSYTLPSMRSATKTDTPVLETPQSLTVLTRKQLDDQNPQTVGQALRYTSGVLSEIDATTRYDSFFLRGFGGFGSQTQFVSFLDGLRLPRGQAFAQTSFEPFLLDRIDILKGPSALMYGQNSPGGLVNIVSRKPNDAEGGSAKLEYGSNNRFQFNFEQQGAFDEENLAQYSVATVLRNGKSRYDGVEEQSFSIAPSLVLTPSEATRFTLGAYMGVDPKGGYFNSIYPKSLSPAHASKLNRDLNVGDPTFDKFKRKQWGVSAGLEQALSNNTVFRSKLRFSHVDVNLESLQMSGPVDANGVIPRRALKSDEDVDGFAWDSNFEYIFNMGDLSHKLLTGIDASWNQSEWQFFGGGAPSLDVNNPVYGGQIGSFMAFIDNRQTTKQTGVYVSDQISFGNFEANLGARYDWINQETNNKLNNTISEQDSKSDSYRAALLYKFANGVSPYVSYSTSFEPTAGVDIFGNSFEPTDAKQKEIGVKFQPSSGDALFTMAAFEIDKTNVLTPSTTPGFSEQTGAIRSRGLEFEARGKLTKQLEIIGALTLQDTEVTKSNVATSIGKRPQAVPEFFGSLWVNYAFEGTLDGFELGAGIRHVGSSYGDDANTLKADGYTLVDLGMRYDLGSVNPNLAGFEATLNVRNLFDKTYYSSCSYDIYCQYGEERNIMLGLKKSW